MAGVSDARGTCSGRRRRVTADMPALNAELRGRRGQGEGDDSDEALRAPGNQDEQSAGRRVHTCDE